MDTTIPTEPLRLPIDHIPPVAVHELSPTAAADLDVAQLCNLVGGNKHAHVRSMVSRIQRRYTSDIPFLEATKAVICQSTPAWHDEINTIHAWTIWHIGFASINAHAFDTEHGFFHNTPSLPTPARSLLDQLNHTPRMIQGMKIHTLLSPILTIGTPLLLFVLWLLLYAVCCLFRICESRRGWLRPVWKTAMTFTPLAGFAAVMENPPTDWTRADWTLQSLKTAGMTSLYAFSSVQSVAAHRKCRADIWTVCGDIQVMRHYIMEIVRPLVLQTWPTMLTQAASNNSDVTKSGLSAYWRFVTDFETDVWGACLEPLGRRMTTVLAACGCVGVVDTPKPLSLLKNMGELYEIMYDLFHRDCIRSAMDHTHEFVAYYEMLRGLQGRVLLQDMHPVQFTVANVDADAKADNARGELTMTNAHLTREGVGNDVDLTSHNWIVTAPNAFGKTTLLKTIGFNVLLAQQWGVSMCDEMTITAPFTAIHTQIDNRDDLLLAVLKKGQTNEESRFESYAANCRRFLDQLLPTSDDNDVSSNTLVLMDEIFAATNETESVAASVATLEHLVSDTLFPRTTVVVSTHAVDICRRLSNNNRYLAMKMDAVTAPTEPDRVCSTYKVVPGVSEIHCAQQVLQKYNFPAQIVTRMRELTTPTTS